jgi:hypothetical protein
VETAPIVLIWTSHVQGESGPVRKIVRVRIARLKVKSSTTAQAWQQITGDVMRAHANSTARDDAGGYGPGLNHRATNPAKPAQARHQT